MNLPKLSALALAGVLSLSLLTACGPKAPAGTPAPTPEVGVTATPTPEVTATPAPEDTPAGGIDIPGQNPPEESASPTPAPKPTATPKPAETPKPVEPTPAPTPTPIVVSVVEQIWDEIKEITTLPSMADVDGEVLSALYGIDAADLEEYICKTPMMNVHATEFFLAKVKDGRMDAVKSGIQGRQANLVEQWSMYLPDQLELVENYQLVVSGNYVLFAISPDAAAAADVFRSHTA